jgi:hypothetical protein
VSGVFHAASWSQRVDLGDLSIETYGDLLREAITDLLEPRGDISQAHRADGR